MRSPDEPHRMSETEELIADIEEQIAELTATIDTYRAYDHREEIQAAKTQILLLRAELVRLRGEGED